MSTKLPQNASPRSDSPYSFIFGWEESYDFPATIDLFHKHYLFPFIVSLLVYLPMLYIGQIIMKRREPFKLRVPMMIWNAGLAIFSIVGFIRIFPEFQYVLKNYGFYHSICVNSFINQKPTRYWIYLFVLSKIPELGDTLFLVLRKQKLIFLHVYHHASVLIFSWFVYADTQAPARWFCVMNFGVHSIMYSYYFLKCVPHIIKIPKWVSMIITTLQVIQMVIGASVITFAHYQVLVGNKCDTTSTLNWAGFLIYVSYLILFSQFFYKAYCSPAPKEIKDKRKLA